MNRFIQPDAADVVCVCGVRGAGKTYWVREFLATIPRVIAWDPMNEYGAALGSRDQLADLAARPLDQGVLRVSVDPGPLAWDDPGEAFDRFAEVASLRGPCVVVIEEISLIASPSSVPAQLRRLLAVGRHLGISLVIVGQRFAQFPRLATGMASRIIAFRQTEPSDLTDIDRRLARRGVSPLPSEIVRSLGVGQYLDWTPDVPLSPNNAASAA